MEAKEQEQYFTADLDALIKQRDDLETENTQLRLENAKLRGAKAGSIAGIETANQLLQKDKKELEQENAELRRALEWTIPRSNICENKCPDYFRDECNYWENENCAPYCVAKAREELKEQNNDAPATENNREKNADQN